MSSSLKFRTPLNQVRGLGSAKEGTHHWWAQRLTAVALVPLLLWFVAALASIADADYLTAVQWMKSPTVTVLMICTIVALFHHAQLGVQVVLEDYVHSEWMKFASIIVVKMLALVLALACIVAVLKVSLGG
ncbi:MAG: succinate dehydrogenase, hydrophobic membrane anchor protein [Gammaproteobacteria bacterium]|nr:succinate dehydrogenase, hydrophobic membrane anchor protein [Gammaproteobacteria bacterium]